MKSITSGNTHLSDFKHIEWIEKQIKMLDDAGICEYRVDHISPQCQVVLKNADYRVAYEHYKYVVRWEKSFISELRETTKEAKKRIMNEQIADFMRVIGNAAGNGLDSCNLYNLTEDQINALKSYGFIIKAWRGTWANYTEYEVSWSE